MSMLEVYFIAFGALGWILTIYFGFFRFKHYQWTKLKVQYDLFTRINLSSSRLFLKLSALSSIKEKNNKISVKHQSALIKYYDNIYEKIYLMRSKLVTQETSNYWLEGIINELKYLNQVDQTVVQKLIKVHEERKYFELVLLEIFSLVKKNELVLKTEIEKLNKQIHN